MKISKVVAILTLSTSVMVQGQPLGSDTNEKRGVTAQSSTGNGGAQRQQQVSGNGVASSFASGSSFDTGSDSDSGSDSVSGSNGGAEHQQQVSGNGVASSFASGNGFDIGSVSDSDSGSFESLAQFIEEDHHPRTNTARL